MRLVIAAALLVSATAHAEHEQAFASWHKVDTASVKDVRGFKLTGGDFTDVWIGRFPDATYTMAGVVLLRCDATPCQGRRVSFGSADKIDVLGVIDLEGSPGALPRGKRRDAKLSARGKFPVLLLQTEETGKRIKLHMISLVEADRGSVVMHDIAYEAGKAGHARSYRLERPELKDPKAPKDAPRDPDAPRDLKAPLELIVIETPHDKQRCPDPLEYSYKLDGRHFRAAELVSPNPC